MSYPQRSRLRVLFARLRASSIPERRGGQQGKAAAREMTPESREVEAVKLPERVARQRAGGAHAQLFENKLAIKACSAC